MNFRQRLFVEEYLVDLNAAGAAARAGYKGKCIKNAASHLLHRAEIAAAIRAAMAARAARTGITPERVLQEYARIAFADGRRFAEWGEGADPAAPPRLPAAAALSADDAAAIAGLGPDTVARFSKPHALRSLARILGLEPIAPQGVARAEP